MSKNPDIVPGDESIEKEFPLLHSIPKRNPFAVPENYFDSLPSEIIEKCRSQAEPKKWGQGILTTLLEYKWRVLATISCVAVICFFATHVNNRPLPYEAMVQNIPDSLIVEHLDNNIADISEFSLEELQQSDNSPASVKSNSDSAGSDQAIIAYLIDHNINVSDIENE